MPEDKDTVETQPEKTYTKAEVEAMVKSAVRVALPAGAPVHSERERIKSQQERLGWHKNPKIEGK